MAGHELRFRRDLARQVPEPDLRAALTPADPIGCKRILQSNDWYPALRLPHVDVVTRAVAGLQPEGVVTSDGVLHEADTVVLGTGFAATELVAPMAVVGLGGRTLARGVGGRRGGPPRDDGQRLPEPVRPLRAQHQPRPQLDRPDDREPAPVRRRRGAAAAAGGRALDGRAARGAAAVQRRAAGPAGRHRLRRRLPQLVPDGGRPQHPELAGVDGVVPGPDPAGAAGRSTGWSPCRPRSARPGCRRRCRHERRLPSSPAASSAAWSGRSSGRPCRCRCSGPTWRPSSARCPCRAAPGSGAAVLGGRPTDVVTARGGDAGPPVLLAHGGAFVTCSPRTHRAFAAHLGRATGGRSTCRTTGSRPSTRTPPAWTTPSPPCASSGRAAARRRQRRRLARALRGAAAARRGRRPAAAGRPGLARSST